MTNHAALAKRLRDIAGDPMWADHAEISKRTLIAAAEQIESSGADAARYRKGAHGSCVSPQGELGMAWVDFNHPSKTARVLWVTDQEVDAAIAAQADTAIDAAMSQQKESP
jgi:hypothetical protein